MKRNEFKTLTLESKYDFLTTHPQRLISKDRTDDLHELLIEEETYDWLLQPSWYLCWRIALQDVDMKGAEHNSQTDSYISTVRLAWEAAESAWERANTAQERGRIIGLQCRYALIISSLNSLADSVPDEMTESLAMAGVWTWKEALAKVNRMLDEERKARTLVGLFRSARSLLDKKKGPEGRIFHQILENVKLLGEDQRKAMTLIDMINMITSVLQTPDVSPEWRDLVQSVVDIAQGLGDDSDSRYCMQVLEKIASSGLTLTEDVVKTIVNTPLTLSNGNYAARLIQAVAPHFTHYEWGPFSLYVVIRHIANYQLSVFRSDQAREETLAVLCSQYAAIDGQQYREGDYGHRAKDPTGRTLEEISRYLSGEWKAVALALSLKHFDGEHRDKLFQEFLALVQERGWIDYTAGEEIQPGRYRYPVLARPKEGAEEIILLAGHSEDAISCYMPYLPDKLFMEATSRIVNNWYDPRPESGDLFYARVERIADSLSHAQGKIFFAEVLRRLRHSRAYDFDNVFRRRKGLAKLIPLLPEGLLSEALEIAKEMLAEVDENTAWLKTYGQDLPDFELDTLAPQRLTAGELLAEMPFAFRFQDVNEVLVEVVIPIATRSSGSLNKQLFALIPHIQDTFAWADLLSRMKGLPNSMLEQTVNACDALSKKDLQSQQAEIVALSLARLARQLSDKSRQIRLFEQALEVAFSNLSSRELGDTVARVASLFHDPDHELQDTDYEDEILKKIRAAFEPALKEWRRLKDREDQVVLLHKLVQLVDERVQQEVLPSLFRWIDIAFPRTDKNRSLAGGIAQEEREAFLKPLIPLIPATKDFSEVFRFARDIGSLSEEEQLDLLGSLLAQMDTPIRAAFEGMVEELTGEPMPEAPADLPEKLTIESLRRDSETPILDFAAWCARIREMSNLPRSDFYKELDKNLLAIYSLGGQEALGAVYEEVARVGSWWLPAEVAQILDELVTRLQKHKQGLDERSGAREGMVFEYLENMYRDVQEVAKIFDSSGPFIEERLIELLSDKERNIRIAAALFLFLRPDHQQTTLSVIEEMMPSFNAYRYEMVISSLLASVLARHGNHYREEYLKKWANKIGWTDQFEKRLTIFALQELSDPTFLD